MRIGEENSTRKAWGERTTAATAFSSTKRKRGIEMRLSFCGRLTQKGGRGVVGGQGSDRRGVMMNGWKSQFLVTKESAQIFKRSSVMKAW